MEDTYDIVVVGGGPGSEVAADRVVRSGLTAVVVEAEAVGGECSYWACVPSKALLRPGAAREAARSVDGARQAVTGVLDQAQVLARRDRFTGRLDDTGQADWLNRAGIPLVRGHGRLAGERRVEVTAADGAVRTLRARLAVVLGPGTEPVLPPVEGLDRIGVWTNRQATTVDAVPERLVVIGGGVVACEMATAWRSLDSSITLLVRDQALLTGWEPCAGEEVTRGLTGLRVAVRFGVSATRVARDETTRTVTVETDDGAVFVCDEVLAATGRRPRTGLDSHWLYAVGDVNHRAPLTHMAKYQARACAAAIVKRAAGRPADTGGGQASSAQADHVAVPQAVFTHPEVASVGLTERAARSGYRGPRRGVPHRRHSRSLAVRGRLPRPRQARRRRDAGSRHRLHAHRPDGDRTHPHGHCRHRGRSPARTSVARRPRLPDGQRGLAAAA
jgi:dihydrolipoamide dehydrogenase